MNSSKSQDGFTIIELLIVIIVIAILAGITIVAFTGVQNRAMTSTGQALTDQLEKKANVYYTVRSGYPGGFTDFANTSEAVLENISETQLLSSIVTAETHQNGRAVSYIPCGPAPYTGARIAYWDFTGTPAAVVRTIGTGC